MATIKKPTAAERLASLTTGVGRDTVSTKVKDATEKSRKRKDGKPPQKRVETGEGRGGAREGAGGPARGVNQQKRVMKQLVAELGNEEITIMARDPINGEMVKLKKPRVVVAVMEMFNIGIQNKDTQSLERFTNRVLGKPIQPVVGDEDEDAIQVDIHGVDRMLEKAYGDDEEDGA